MLAEELPSEGLPLARVAVHVGSIVQVSLSIIGLAVIISCFPFFEELVGLPGHSDFIIHSNICTTSIMIFSGCIGIYVTRASTLAWGKQARLRTASVKAGIEALLFLYMAPLAATVCFWFVSNPGTIWSKVGKCISQLPPLFFQFMWASACYNYWKLLIVDGFVTHRRQCAAEKAEIYSESSEPLLNPPREEPEENSIFSLPTTARISDGDSLTIHVEESTEECAPVGEASEIPELAVSHSIGSSSHHTMDATNLLAPSMEAIYIHSANLGLSGKENSLLGEATGPIHTSEVSGSERCGYSNIAEEYKSKLPRSPTCMPTDARRKVLDDCNDAQAQAVLAGATDALRGAQSEGAASHHRGATSIPYKPSATRSAGDEDNSVSLSKLMGIIKARQNVSKLPEHFIGAASAMSPWSHGGPKTLGSTSLCAEGSEQSLDSEQQSEAKASPGYRQRIVNLGSNMPTGATALGSKMSSYLTRMRSSFQQSH